MAENVDLTFSFKWSKEHTAQLIKLRGENDELFTGVKHSASVAWGIASIQGQERGEVGNPLLPLGPGLSPWISLAHRSIRSLCGQVTQERARTASSWEPERREAAWRDDAASQFPAFPPLKQPSPGCPSGLRVRPDDVRAELNGLSLRPDSFVRPGSSISVPT
ncbi:unnamed protein product [Gadus morhua 'NCC']